MEVMTIKLPKRLLQRVKDEARGKRTTKSAVVRSCLEEAFSQRREGSCLDLAADLVGILDGPRDLSTNKKYLRGLGRERKPAR